MGQTVTYTSYNAPSSISLGNYGMTFTYGPDNNREKTVLTDPTGNTATRYYGNAYEKTVFTNGSPSTEVNYIQCGGDLVGMYINQPSITGSGDMYYVYSDHLGSILTVTNGSTKTYNQSFDAWGSYRNPTDGSYNNIPTNPSWLYRGYTGHEHLAPFQLINANGRLYDPFVNSMLSPDITVQSPTNTQNYNRYSYCLNNPLKYSDPSGFSYIATTDMQANMAAAYANASAFAASINNELNAVDLYVGFDFQDQLSAGGGSGNDGGGGTGQGTAGNGGVSTGNTGTGADQTGGPSTPGQEAAILGPVPTFGVTPSPTTGAGENYTEAIVGAVVIGASMLAPEMTPDFQEYGDQLISALEESEPTVGAEQAILSGGSNVLQEATQAQINGGYIPDNWEIGTLEEGDMVGRIGSPQGNFYFNLNSVTLDNVPSLYNQLQINTNNGMQGEFNIYEINNTINVGQSLIQNNMNNGLGGGFQYYIQNPTQNLTPTWTIPLSW